MAGHYIDNVAFETMIARFIRAKRAKRVRRKEINTLQEQLVGQFYLLAENILRAFNFRLIDRDEALQEAAMICLLKVESFDPEYRNAKGEKAKAFNYLTTCCLNHFRQLYRSSKNYMEFKLRYHDHMCRKHPEMKARQTIDLSVTKDGAA